MLNLRYNCEYPFFAGILEDSIQSYTKDDNENFKTIVMFDCRGVELVDFDFRVRNFELDIKYHTNVNIHFILEYKGIFYINTNAEKRVALA
jgi:hypothetical protein